MQRAPQAFQEDTRDPQCLLGRLQMGGRAEEDRRVRV